MIIAKTTKSGVIHSGSLESDSFLALKHLCF